MILTWFIRPLVIWHLLFMMGVHSKRVYARSAGYCPKAIVQVEGGGSCTEGEKDCLDWTPEGKKVVDEIRRGCSEGRTGDENCCLYGIFIYRDGKATAICGPRMQEASK